MVLRALNHSAAAVAVSDARGFTVAVAVAVARRTMYIIILYIIRGRLYQFSGGVEVVM